MSNYAYCINVMNVSLVHFYKMLQFQYCFQCYYPQFILPEIKTPVFVINTAYDAYQVCVLGLSV